MIWVTSDCHFNHRNIIDYCNRPYSNCEEMNEALIRNWNERVQPRDTVIVVGDMFMGSPDTIDDIVPRLNGSIYLVDGNHDSPKHIDRMNANGIRPVGHELYVTAYRNSKGSWCEFYAIHDPAEIPEDISAGQGKDIIYLYGHVHDAAPRGIHAGNPGVYYFHVGADTNDYAPVALEYIYEEYNEFKKKVKKGDKELS